MFQNEHVLNCIIISDVSGNPVQRRRRLRRKAPFHLDYESVATSNDNDGCSSENVRQIGGNERFNWPTIVSTSATPETPRIGARLRLEASVAGEPECILWLKVCFVRRLRAFSEKLRTADRSHVDAFRRCSTITSSPFSDSIPLTSGFTQFPSKTRTD